MKEIEIFRAEDKTDLTLQYAEAGIHAGFPSPAQDYIENGIDLNKELIHHKASTFYGRVVGDSMIDAGIDEGDILVIDKQLTPQEGDLVIGFIDGEFAIKFLRFKGGRALLCAANSKYPDIDVTDSESFRVWGVVTYTIKKRNNRI